MAKKILKIGLPKGSLQENTFKLFKKAGFQLSVPSRSYFPSIDDIELSPMLVHAKEMAKHVEQGVLDCGLTGEDWMVENSCQLKVVAPLEYAKSGFSKVRWVLAVPEDSKIKKVKDLEGKRISTELVGLTKKFLKKHNVKAQVNFSWGATEAKPPLLADAIVDLTETGTSLRANRLRILDTVFESKTLFVANKESYKDDWKKRKIESLTMLLQGAIDARSRVGLKLNAPKDNLQKILSILPALQTPTISALADDKWHSVEVVMEETVVRDLIPKLSRAGATGIIEYPLNKVIF